MANIFTQQKLVDSNKRALIKLTGVIDGTAYANAIAVDVSTLAYALNANGYIMSSNTDPLSAYYVGLKRVWGDVNVSGTLKLQWSGDGNADIVIVGADAQSIDLGGVAITNNVANTNGDILISTVGQAANNSYTIFLDLVKISGYDFGQTADPKAFNWHNRGLI